MFLKENENNEEEVIVLVSENIHNLPSNLITMDHIEPPDIFDNYNNFNLEIESQEADENIDGNEFAFKNSESIDSKYCMLPKEFFSNKDVPPPLVCKSWLSLVYRKIRKKQTHVEEDESIVEDSMPLSQLKTILRNDAPDLKDETVKVRPKRKSAKPYKKFDSCDSDTGSILSDFSDEYLRELKTEKKFRQKSKNLNVLIINRKRGRPKKSAQTRKDLESNQVLDNSNQKDDSDDWWCDDKNDSDLDIPWQSNLLNTEEIKTDTTNSYQEHDYFKVDNEKPEENPISTPSKKREKKLLVSEVDGQSKLVFPCSECNKSFSAATTLKYHMRIHTGTLIKCTECDKGFTTNYLLKCHMRIHNGDLFMCHKCGRGFTTAELLKVHSRGHTGDRPFTCHVCGKAFPSASNLRQHKETHEVVKKYLCFQCGSSFSQKRCLDGHMLSHGEKNHICTICGKLWARKSDLTEHMRVHTGSKPYSCNLCPQKFTQASSLRRHQIVHMEAKPIPCLTCGRLFKCEDYYKRHVKKHEKESNQIVNNANE